MCVTVQVGPTNELTKLRLGSYNNLVQKQAGWKTFSFFSRDGSVWLFPTSYVEDNHSSRMKSSRTPILQLTLDKKKSVLHSLFLIQSNWVTAICWRNCVAALIAIGVKWGLSNFALLECMCPSITHCHESTGLNWQDFTSHGKKKCLWYWWVLRVRWGHALLPWWSVLSNSKAKIRFHIQIRILNM